MRQLIAVALGVSLLANVASAAEIGRDDVYGCWKNDNSASGDLCFSPDAKVVYKGQQAPKPTGPEGYEFAFADVPPGCTMYCRLGRRYTDGIGTQL